MASQTVGGVPRWVPWMVVLALGPCASWPASAAQPTRGGATATPAVYWVHGQPLAGRGRFTGNDAIVVDGATVSTRSGCPPELARVDRTGGLHVRWARCEGTTGTVTLQGKVDEAAGVLQGEVMVANVPGTVLVVATTASEDAIRVGTSNVQFLPSTFVSKDVAIAKKISQRIVASKYDVIVLTEVFDEDARKDDPTYSFVANLKSAYPYRVEYLSGGTLANEDSGLMLFSRFPFEPLPETTYQAHDYCPSCDTPPPSPYCLGTDCSRVAFIEFEECVGDDCWSEKGAGYVRIRNPQTNHIYNVVFSHTQATYADDDAETQQEVWDARAAQFADMRDLLEGSMTDAQIDGEDIFVFGDLNVDGDPSDPDLGDHPELPHNLFEWKKLFASAGSFYNDVLRDSWHDDTSPQDRGLTGPMHWGKGPDAGARLDYFLRKRETRLCVEHISLAHNLRAHSPVTESNLGEPGTEAGADMLSDHLGIVADLGPVGTACRASDPKVVALPLPGGTQVFSGSLRHAGGMYWYRFDEPGTYSFEVPGEAEFHVYEATDLSTPLVPYKEKTSVIKNPTGVQEVIAPKFRIPTAPFYVRVFDAQRTHAGFFQLWARQHRCLGLDDTCFLGPAQRLHHLFPANVPLNAEDTAYFELDTEAADSGAAQTLAFLVQEMNAPHLTLELHEPSGPGSQKLDEDVSPGFYPGGKFFYGLRIDASETAARTLFLLVHRKDVAVADDYVVEWRTNLTVLHGSQVAVSGAATERLVNFEQEDSLGDDTIYFSLWLDGVEVIHQHDLGDFDTGNEKGLEGVIGTRRFVNNATFVLYEQDANKDGGGAEGDDDVTEEPIDPLAPEKVGALGEILTFRWESGVNEAAAVSGYYELVYNVRHGLDTK